MAHNGFRYDTTVAPHLYRHRRLCRRCHARPLQGRVRSLRTRRSHVFIASNGADGKGILAYDWDTVAGELTPVGVAAAVPTADWLTSSRRREYVYSASGIRSFNGKPTGEVASFRLKDGRLEQLSARNGAGAGTTHIAVDRTGGMAVSADYGGGGSAATTRLPAACSVRQCGPSTTRSTGPAPQQTRAHAHFVSFSPDNRFAYINDLGGDSIHIYRIDPATAGMTPAGTYRATPGCGPRTLHFHPNGHTAYSVNEISSHGGRAGLEQEGWKPGRGDQNGAVAGGLSRPHQCLRHNHRARWAVCLL